MTAPKEHAALLDLLLRHAPLDCGTCGTKGILPSLGKLDQSAWPLDAAVYACTSGNCEWKRTVQLVLPDASKDGVTVGVEVAI